MTHRTLTAPRKAPGCLGSREGTKPGVKLGVQAARGACGPGRGLWEGFPVEAGLGHPSPSTGLHHTLPRLQPKGFLTGPTSLPLQDVSNSQCLVGRGRGGGRRDGSPASRAKNNVQWPLDTQMMPTLYSECPSSPPSPTLPSLTRTQPGLEGVAVSGLCMGAQASGCPTGGRGRHVPCVHHPVPGHHGHPHVQVGQHPPRSLDKPLPA